jgi:large subunit ribosomal protein L22
MARYSYAFQGFDATKHVRASIREKKISHKHARETAKAIKGLTLEKARDYMLSVIAKERAIPFARFKNQVGHRSDPGMMSGRYPEKTAGEFLKLLDNLESNAEYKGMDMDRLKIINATSHKGVAIKRFIPRAQGRETRRKNKEHNQEVKAPELPE